MGFENPVLGFENPVLGFGNPVLGFENPVLGFQNPVLGFQTLQRRVLPLENPPTPGFATGKPPTPGFGVGKSLAPGGAAQVLTAPESGGRGLGQPCASPLGNSGTVRVAPPEFAFFETQKHPQNGDGCKMVLIFGYMGWLGKWFGQICMRLGEVFYKGSTPSLVRWKGGL